jgi:hypothetical protein
VGFRSRVEGGVDGTEGGHSGENWFEGSVKVSTDVAMNDGKVSGICEECEGGESCCGG